jgi:hypothetical protein
MNATCAPCFGLGTVAALSDYISVPLALSDVDIGFTLSEDKASLAELCGWAGCSLIPGPSALPKALPHIWLEIILFFHHSPMEPILLATPLYSPGC